GIPWLAAVFIGSLSSAFACVEPGTRAKLAADAGSGRLGPCFYLAHLGNVLDEELVLSIETASACRSEARWALRLACACRGDRSRQLTTDIVSNRPGAQARRLSVGRGLTREGPVRFRNRPTVSTQRATTWVGQLRGHRQTGGSE